MGPLLTLRDMTRDASWPLMVRFSCLRNSRLGEKITFIDFLCCNTALWSATKSTLGNLASGGHFVHHSLSSVAKVRGIKNKIRRIPAYSTTSSVPFRTQLRVRGLNAGLCHRHLLPWQLLLQVQAGGRLRSHLCNSRSGGDLLSPRLHSTTSPTNSLKRNSLELICTSRCPGTGRKGNPPEVVLCPQGRPVEKAKGEVGCNRRSKVAVSQCCSSHLFQAMETAFDEFENRGDFDGNDIGFVSRVGKRFFVNSGGASIRPTPFRTEL